MNKTEPTTRSVAVFESRGLRDGTEALITQLKMEAAILLDTINEIEVPPGNSEAGRLIALAKTELESTVMWATKAVSRYYPSENL